ncbi:hypothetical protein C9374_003272 [Naegleria lovaniensis]|uniref:Uncharacterized protein n=1 Tax=Naegleria lovaniensis TaxID=51637 RepID=A0AA88GR16_NAELO|nr:uncharacterized protein C9374_003272 [Naegleria lovaniensis]KAG2385457.1 hypothetical protein C9374_003272 [Naegleria lovaniensis]
MSLDPFTSRRHDPLCSDEWNCIFQFIPSNDFSLIISLLQVNKFLHFHILEKLKIQNRYIQKNTELYALGGSMDIRSTNLVHGFMEAVIPFKALHLIPTGKSYTHEQIIRLLTNNVCIAVFRNIEKTKLYTGLSGCTCIPFNTCPQAECCTYNYVPIHRSSMDHSHALYYITCKTNLILSQEQASALEMYSHFFMRNEHCSSCCRNCCCYNANYENHSVPLNIQANQEEILESETVISNERHFHFEHLFELIAYSEPRNATKIVRVKQDGNCLLM